MRALWGPVGRIQEVHWKLNREAVQAEGVGAVEDEVGSSRSKGGGALEVTGDQGRRAGQGGGLAPHCEGRGDTGRSPAGTVEGAQSAGDCRGGSEEWG